MVDKQVIEEIKNNANIVEVIGDVISLQKAGQICLECIGIG